MQKLIFILLVIFTVAYSDIINVPGDQSSIQGGINTSDHGDTVLVAPGEYFENIQFAGKRILLTSQFIFEKDTSFISSTIINGSGNNNSVVKFSFNEDTTSILNGFTITGGKGSFYSGWASYAGGGIYVTNGAKITNNHIINNSIHHNTNEVDGGGIFIVTGYSNDDTNGNVIIKNNLIANNKISGRKWIIGGGVAVFGFGKTLISNNVIRNNSVNAELPHDWISGGGGIFILDRSPKIIKNIIVGNEAQNGGGIAAMGFPRGFNFRLINNTIADNNASITGGGAWFSNGHATVVNNIFWNNSAPKNPDIFTRGELNISYSITQEAFPGTGNIQTDPLFENSDYHLGGLSPAIDAGNPEEKFNDLADPDNPSEPLWPAKGSLTADIGSFGGNDAVNLAIEDFIIEENFLYKQFSDMHYRFAYPLNYDHINLYPLTIVLHGSGNWGTDNESQLHEGLSWRVNAEHYGYNDFTILPQAPTNGGWDASANLNTVFNLIKTTIENFPIDTTKIVITGWSQGAVGTWRLLNLHPRLFSAAVPLSGDDRGGFGKIKHIPVWVNHGKSDEEVAVSTSQYYISEFENTGLNAIYTENLSDEQISDAINNNARLFYSEIIGAGHDINRYAYDNNFLFDWLNKQSLPLIRPAETSISSISKDSVLFTLVFLNPHNFQHNQTLRVEDFETNPIDSLPLFDDGLHGDEKAGDGVWGNYFKPVPEVKFYRLGVQIANIDREHEFFFNDVARYTTTGPVQPPEQAYIDTSYNKDTNTQSFFLILQNFDTSAIAEDLSVTLSTDDLRIDKMEIDTRTFLDLAPGEIDTSDIFTFFSFIYGDGFLPDCTLINPISFNVDVSSDGYLYWTSSFEFVADKISAIKGEQLLLPEKYYLNQNYPNPFNPSTAIKYQLPKTSKVDLSIYNLLGQKVISLVNKKQNAGQYAIEWDASGFSSGVYFLKMKTNTGFVQTRKLIVLK
ncbi:MAG: T9SS C-terminal target domain-containing protein [Calditrichaeota bacterium]|nr:MAG: T9SS C-terminal target domain-containing protein [Calditrichota bacterium]MBL1204128.1 T9SS C-terminal target domain-containing protein [Calditrichota bacterium]NOG43959.1 T9SS type A sorting domain-containing protein [Calditrichota bacterium]